MSKDYDYFEVENNKVKRLTDICPKNQYRVVGKETIKQLDILPDALVEKYDSALILSSGLPEPYCYYFINGNRIDEPDESIDQMPFGFISSGSNSPVTSGCLVQHGDWNNRTTDIPNDFWEKSQRSRINDYYPLSELPEDNSGKIKDLKIDSQKSAANDLLRQLKFHL